MASHASRKVVFAALIGNSRNAGTVSFGNVKRAISILERRIEKRGRDITHLFIEAQDAIPDATEAN